MLCSGGRTGTLRGSLETREAGEAIYGGVKRIYF